MVLAAHGIDDERRAVKERGHRADAEPLEARATLHPASKP
jgi:hypothetical protein